MPLRPHHDGSPLYVSSQTPELGESVLVRVRIPPGFGELDSVHVRSNPDHEPHFSPAERVATIDGWDWWEAEVVVANPVHGYRFLILLVSGETLWLNATGVHTIETLDMDDFRLVTFPAPPVWAKSTVMYQIFPDRFARSAAASARELPDWAERAEWGDEVIHVGPSTEKQFYGGDLDGIVDHLDHLERLGVNLLYLTPFFPARSNHRYDATSFGHVDPLLGGDEALLRLVAQAHARGIRVIGDLTSNHSGDAHEWFQASHRTPGAAESDFYYWLDNEQTSYVSWLGVPSLPKFNWSSAELRRRFIQGPGSVVAHWLGEPYRLDGWRVDVSNMTGRYLDEDLNREVRRLIRGTMLEVNPDTILIGESTNDAAHDFDGDSWHGAMTYANFTMPVWSWLSEPGSRAAGGIGMPLGRVPTITGQQLLDAHQRFTAAFPWRVRLHNMNALDTHDTPRFLSHARPGTVPVAFGLAVTLPGIPVVFAGDEFGLTGDDGEHSRTPMPWGTDSPFIDVYAALIHLRRAHPALNEGGIRWLHAGDDVLVFVRESAEECVLVVAARAPVDLTIDADAVAGGPVALIGQVVATRTSLGLHLAADGPAFGAFALPGIALPPVTEPPTA
ncbi:maltodextrin glucosidase [soil metagenome]